MLGLLLKTQTSLSTVNHLLVETTSQVCDGITSGDTYLDTFTYLSYI